VGVTARPTAAVFIIPSVSRSYPKLSHPFFDECILMLDADVRLSFLTEA
jgi:hypothetical protein